MPLKPRGQDQHFSGARNKMLLQSKMLQKFCSRIKITILQHFFALLACFTHLQQNLPVAHMYQHYFCIILTFLAHALHKQTWLFKKTNLTMQIKNRELWSLGYSRSVENLKKERLFELFEGKYSIEMLEKVFHTLRTCFLKEFKKYKEGMIPKKCWKFYTAMSFLKE